MRRSTDRIFFHGSYQDNGPSNWSIYSRSVIRNAEHHTCRRGAPIHIAIHFGQSGQYKEEQGLPAGNDSMLRIHDGIIQCVHMLNIYIRFYRLTDLADGNWNIGKDHALQLIPMIVVSYDRRMLISNPL